MIMNPLKFLDLIPFNGVLNCLGVAKSYDKLNNTFMGLDKKVYCVKLGF
jgi:hypothetical protein